MESPSAKTITNQQPPAEEALTKIDPQKMHEKCTDKSLHPRDRSGVYFIPPPSAADPERARTRMIAMMICLPEMYAKFRWEMTSLLFDTEATQARQEGRLYEHYRQQLLFEIDALLEQERDAEVPEHDQAVRLAFDFRNRLDEIFQHFCELHEADHQKVLEEKTDALMEELDFQEIFDLNTLEPLGSGAFGEVYKVWCTLTNTWMALKFINPQRSSSSHRLRDEALCGVQVNDIQQSPTTYVAQLMRTAFPYLPETKGHMMIAMDYIPGSNLRTVMEREHFNPKEAIRIVSEIAFVVSEYHQRGVIHRDLKPANVQLTPEHGVFVLDNGLSIQESQETGVVIQSSETPIRQGIHPTCETIRSRKSSLEATAAFANRPSTKGARGTPLYMSPEHSDPRLKCGQGSDVWSIGMMWMEMELGEPILIDIPNSLQLIECLSNHRKGHIDIRKMIEAKMTERGKSYTPLKASIAEAVFHPQADQRPSADQFGVLLSLMNILSTLDLRERAQRFELYIEQRTAQLAKRISSESEETEQPQMIEGLEFTGVIKWIQNLSNTHETLEKHDLFVVGAAIDELINNLHKNR